jgi:hypothetical protein
MFRYQICHFRTKFILLNYNTEFQLSEHIKCFNLHLDFCAVVLFRLL